MAKQPTVTLLDLMPVTGCGNLRALATIRIGPCEFRKVRLIWQDKQSPWVSPPQESYEVNGVRRFITLVRWPSNWNKPILDAVLDAYNAGGSTEAMDFHDEVRQRAGIGGKA